VVSKQTSKQSKIMAAPAINDTMIRLSGMISPEIYKRGLHSSVWLDLPKQEAWPEGQGTELRVFTFGRSLPRTAPTWETVTPSADGSTPGGGACIPPKQTLEFTQDFATYNLQHTALESPDICLLDLFSAFKAEQQISNIMEILAENTRQLWIERNRSEFVRLCPNKYVATAGGFLAPATNNFATTASGTGAAAHANLTGGHLKRLYAQLIRMGAGKGSYGTVDGRPSFMAIIGMETSEIIAQETQYRQDIRWSDRVPELLKPLGVEKMFKGFWLTDEVNPPRYNLSGTTWTEVKPYVWSGTGASTKLIENPLYETAAYEDTVIYHQDVLRHVVFPVARNYGKLTFEPQKYRGEWKWLNVVDRDDNPDGNYGFFRGVFASGSKPVFPQYGAIIRHLRCNLPIEGAACPANS